MRIITAFSGILTLVLAVGLATAAENGKKSAQRPSAGKAAVREARAADEKEIRQAVDAFVKAYNKHDTPAIAALFTAEGSTISEEGNVTKGREAIERLFADLFKKHPETMVENTIESIHFTGPNHALETGLTTTTLDKSSEVEKSRYQVVHVKQDGQWLMASAADLPEDAWTGEGPLSQLDCLIGHWMDESRDALVLTSYEWSDSHRFLLGRFIVQIAGKPAVTGVHRIGWDPLKKTLHSWVFDSEGGYAEGDWTNTDETWTAKMSGYTSSGKATTCTQIITVLDHDHLNIQIVDRTLGGEKLPDGEKILVVRRAPAPNNN